MAGVVDSRKTGQSRGEPEAACRVLRSEGMQLLVLPPRADPEAVFVQARPNRVLYPEIVPDGPGVWVGAAHWRVRIQLEHREGIGHVSAGITRDPHLQRIDHSRGKRESVLN